MKRALIIIFSLTVLSYYASGQSTTSAKEIIKKIDSLAKANDITKCTVSLETFNDERLITNAAFSFDGNFLVITQGRKDQEILYFNIDRLVYFRIQSGQLYFEF